jgi:hypothetical protein
MENKDKLLKTFYFKSIFKFKITFVVVIVAKLSRAIFVNIKIENISIQLYSTISIGFIVTKRQIHEMKKNVFIFNFTLIKKFKLY